jgi:DNA-binding transcriptional MocR family regulator
MEVQGSEAGMNLAVTLPKGFRDREIAAQAVNENLWLSPLSANYLGRTARQGFNLGFGSTMVEQIPAAVRKLYRLLAG